ncbi:hypothetical protein [Streptomyces sp. CA-111067]|uniref:hypothetical protein n=1 Tax=Streptomyces sp. CA-111067 TaxID=3240046 RepID=UPI003D958A1A
MVLIAEDDVRPAVLVGGMLRASWRRELYRALGGSGDTVALWNAVERAAAVAEASGAQLREIVEAVVAEGYEELGSGFVGNPGIPEDYLLELCERGLLIDALGHRAGPRRLLARMCELHRYPEAVLTLGLELYRDPAVPPGEFAGFVGRYLYVSEGWLLRALAEATPDSALKQAMYEDALGAATSAHARQAAGVHARHLANEAGADAVQLARFLDRHPDAQVLVLPLDSRVPDPARSDLLESRARASADPRVREALRRREQRRDASGPSLDAEAAAVLAATGTPDVLLLLAANPRTPRPILRELSLRRTSPGARAIRSAAARTLRSQGRRER